jgi:IMP dehydrogenase
MLGMLLAGTDETPGIVVTRNGRKMKIARGMASSEATLDRNIREDPTHSTSTWEIMAESDVPAEGIQTPVHYRGSVKEVLQQLLGGLRSGMSYCDAATIEQMNEKARFMRQTQAGISEAGAHGEEGF